MSLKDDIFNTLAGKPKPVAGLALKTATAAASGAGRATKAPLIDSRPKLKLAPAMPYMAMKSGLPLQKKM